MTKKQLKQYAKRFLELEKQLYNENLSKEDRLKIQNKMDMLTEEVIVSGGDEGIVNLLAIDEYIQKFLWFLKKFLVLYKCNKTASSS